MNENDIQEIARQVSHLTILIEHLYEVSGEGKPEIELPEEIIGKKSIIKQMSDVIKVHSKSFDEKWDEKQKKQHKAEHEEMLSKLKQFQEA